VVLVTPAMAMATTAAEDMAGAAELTPTLVIVADVTVVTTGVVVKARTEAKVDRRTTVRTSLAPDSNATTVARTRTVEAVEVVVVDLSAMGPQIVATPGDQSWTRKSASA
jgi:hypothetical protein